METTKQIADRVHARILRGFKYRTDESNYGVEEDWRFPDNVDRVTDDCDGFAIACRVLLREEGLDTRLVVCYTETNEGHLVCATGNLILDNRQRKVTTKEALEKSGYNFKFVSGLDPGDEWKELI